jgi:UDP-GlcNAc:undecaprenyl-phosphate GlcNAc-1-phosphate transferase
MKLVLIFLLLMIILHFGIKKFIKFLNNKSVIKSYDTIQKIHKGYIPRFGGILFFIVCNIYFLIFYNLQYENSLFLIIPLVFICLFEDFHIHTNVYLRLIIVFLTSFSLLTFNFSHFPEIDFPFISKILFNNYMSAIFFSICMVSLVNGMNMIDGTNGMLCLNVYSILGSLLIIFPDNFLFLTLPMIIDSMVILLFFLFLNYRNKLFFGDFGSYFFGLILGYLIIHHFTNSFLMTWNAMIILIYPVYELTHTTFRRIIFKTNIFKADNFHLHSLIYKNLLSRDRSQLYSSNMTSLILSPLIFYPPLLFFIFDNVVINYPILFIGLYILIYNIIYLYFYANTIK